MVKKSETPDVLLNGRAALCAGRDDMSDDDEFDDGENDKTRHRFSKPEHLKQMLESGSIPDAAMIHAARKRRQRAREQGKHLDHLPFDIYMNINIFQGLLTAYPSRSRRRRQSSVLACHARMWRATSRTMRSVWI